MKQRSMTWLEGAVLLALGGLLVCFPAQSVQAARRGVALCLDLLIPSLFPFLVLSSLCISTGLAATLARRVQGPMGRLFGVGGGSAAFLLGAVGGYPVGPRTLAQLLDRRDCTPREARRLALFCNQCGPAFFLGAAGAGVFGSRRAGLLLLVCHFLAACLLGMALHLLLDRERPVSPAPHARPERRSLAAALPDCVSSAFQATLNICAYVVLFSVLTALAEASGLLPGLVRVFEALLPGEHTATLARSLLIGVLELSTGTTTLAEAASAPLALPLAAFLLGWGGFSVHGQAWPFLRQTGVSPRAYLLAKLLHGLLAALLTGAAVQLFPLSLPTMAARPVLTSGVLPGRGLALLCLGLGLCASLPQKRGGNARRKRL